MIKDSHTKAYVTGFILSLVFTAIPYFLVVRHIVSGTGLAATVLVFAVLQMLVQIIFFLHLGRNPKMYWQIGFFVATVGAVLVVVVGSVIIMAHLHRNMTPKDVTDKITSDEAVHQVDGRQVGTCPGGITTVHMITLKNNQATPRHTDAKLCETIIIYNADNQTRDIEYGVHEHHETYGGQYGDTLSPGHNMVIPLTESGTHGFHDHIQDEISGDFTVTP